MSEEQRGFKGIWIPAQIWLDDSLSALDKVIYAEIDSLDCEDGCFASNAYIASFCQCSESKVSKSVKKLIDHGYIERDGFDGRKRILRSCLAKNASLPSKKCYPASEKMPTINIDSNKDIKKDRYMRFTPPTVEEVSAYCEERNNGINPERFIDFYESKGWMVGRNRMKDWKAAIRTWEQRDNRPQKKQDYKPDTDEWEEF